MNESWPFSTADISPVPGTIKERYEDFRVEEIPAYEPSGSGDHVYFQVEKQGLSTGRAVQDIARALNVPKRNIGMAGQKDARGVTVQWFSLEHVDPARIEQMQIPRVRVLRVDRHRNKLRMGHLKGNRFVIRVRQTDPTRLEDVRDILSKLHRDGVPNYFGPQRFGDRGDTWKVGQALLTGAFEQAAAVVAGAPEPGDTGAILKARELFAAARYREAAGAWPRGFIECAALCRNMAKTGGDAQAALLALDRRALKFYISAFQSKIFNEVVARRIDALAALRCGDVAWKHDSGAVFLVDDANSEQPRADRFEISPTGPLFGHKMKLTAGETLEEENAVLLGFGLGPGDFHRSGPFKAPGGRRPLRFRPENPHAEPGTDENGTYLQIEFDLPAGCYATTVLREIGKESLTEERFFKQD